LSSIDESAKTGPGPDGVQGKDMNEKGDEKGIEKNGNPWYFKERHGMEKRAPLDDLQTLGKRIGLKRRSRRPWPRKFG
jgi:hypothetical protein